MPDVGINLTMQEQVSGIAPKVSEALRKMSDAGKELRDSLDLTGLEDEYKQFADRINKVYDAQQAQKGRGQAQPGQLIQQMGGAVPGMLRAGGGVAQRLGQTGDVVGAGAGALDILGGIINKMGPAGWVISAFGALGVAGNALVKQYEKQIPELAELTATLDRFGDTSEETSANFKNVMDEVSGKAAEFGFSLEYGMNVTKQIAGITGGVGAIEGAGKVEEWKKGRGAGVDVGLLAEYYGKARRFGQEKDVFERAYGGLQAAGMGPGLFQEYLQSTLQIFEQGLSRGIVKGFDEIDITQTWLAKLGDVFKGQYGLQVYQQMEQAMVGATALADEGDVLIYRATKRFLEEDKKRPVSHFEIQKEMEKGLSLDIFDQLRKDIGEITKSEYERIRILKQTLDEAPSLTIAEKLWYVPEAEEYRKQLSGAGLVMETPEGKLSKAQEEMRNYIRRFGAGLLPLKSAAIAGTTETIGKIAEALWQDKGRQEIKSEYTRILSGNTTLIAGTGVIGPGMVGPALQAQDLNQKIIDVAMSEGRYKSETVQSAKDVINFFGTLSEKNRSELMEKGIVKRILEETVWAEKSPGGREVLASELSGLLRELTTAVKDLQNAAKDAGNVELNLRDAPKGTYDLGDKPLRDYR